MIKKNLEFKKGNGTVKIVMNGFTSSQSARMADAVEKMTDCTVLSSRPGCVFVHLKKGTNMESFTESVVNSFESLR